MTDIAIVSAGLREPSSTRLLADRLDAAVRDELSGANLPVTATIIELRPLARPTVDALLTGVASADLQAAFDTLAGADGLVAVTPAFNASFSGLFKLFFDVLPPETLADMPVLIAATGGTERHSLVLEHALRPMFSYLHAIVSPTGVYAATSEFGAGSGTAAGAGTEPDPLGERIRKAAAAFSRLVRSCGPREHRDLFSDELTTMERLLGTSGPDQTL